MFNWLKQQTNKLVKKAKEDANQPIREKKQPSVRPVSIVHQPAVIRQPSVKFTKVTAKRQRNTITKIKQPVLTAAERKQAQKAMDDVGGYIAQHGRQQMREFRADMGLSQGVQPTAVNVPAYIDARGEILKKYANYEGDRDAAEEAARDMNEMGYKTLIKKYKQGNYEIHVVYRSEQKKIKSNASKAPKPDIPQMTFVNGYAYKMVKNYNTNIYAAKDAANEIKEQGNRAHIKKFKHGHDNIYVLYRHKKEQKTKNPTITYSVAARKKKNVDWI